MNTITLAKFEIKGLNLRYKNYYSYVEYIKSNNKIVKIQSWGTIPFDTFSKEEQKQIMNELKEWDKIIY